MRPELQPLSDACLALAKEAFEWIKILTEYEAAGKRITDEELHKMTSKGAWEQYLKAGGSLTMLNRQLPEGLDFGEQYDRLCREAGIEVRRD